MVVEDSFSGLPDESSRGLWVNPEDYGLCNGKTRETDIRREV